MSDGHFSFASLISGRDDFEESFWPSFTDIMMVITMIFLIVTVAVVLTNTRLLDELRHSILAEQSAQQEAQKAAFEAQRSALEAQKAAEQAEFQLKANATLEEQLDYLQQRSSSLEMELLRSRAEAEQARTASTDKDAALAELQDKTQEQQSALATRDKTLDDLQKQFADIMAERERTQAELAAARDSADSKETELTALRTKVDESEKQLLSLKGEYTELDSKYQKLLRPARSAKGKQVVEVVYSKSGYSIRKPGEGSLRSVSRAALESELAGLKAQHSTDLYVKVIIPDNSGLSYNEAWRFTSDMLSKYDYYSEP
ncbi:hypothetical protein [Thiothrix nivea]|uniref:Uncharacterized protein n=1 Tax=Thiothrix nivea (strain ATCC 35100 / DSM 5205 / JP2) TaxID=870187 RepID=A0A656HCB8_THINJ|nr:hypothetical protein [Thiothrix nivea]EIJ33644.1 hypothetical protein Thini_1020 [Thiothrix nivea DSM 5205]